MSAPEKKTRLCVKGQLNFQDVCMSDSFFALVYTFTKIDLTTIISHTFM